MATRNIPFPDKVRDMVLDVITHVRRQEYTPEQLCQLQKIIECKYFYWWCMDMCIVIMAGILYGNPDIWIPRS